ncbi:MAG: TRAP transporter substrate-binding protein [Oscillospiraceae bacterium]|nr:TRAP transporter substrate-binding protein [Oscillospiraceae bacterium]
MNKTLRTLLCLLLALSLCLALCACGSTNDTSDDTADSAAVEDAAADEEAAADETAADDEDVNADEPVTLVMSTSKNQTESGGIFLDYFCDYVEEASNGSITFERYYGGTLASSTEELSMLSSGAISVASIMSNQFSDALPLLQFPDMGFESNEEPTAYFCYMLLEYEETASLLEEEAAASNIKYLGYLAGGTRVWFSKTPITSLDDGQGLIFGGMSGLALMEELGFSTVSTAPPDCYESLSRGIVDLCGLNLIAACDMMWYEVAPNVTIYGAYACGSPLTINLDVWNSLSAEQQAILQEAADAACDYSLQYVLDNENAYLENLESEWGATVYEFSDEDAGTYRDAALYIGCLDAYTRAQSVGNTDEMQIILQACADYWDTDISDIFA